MLRRPYWEQRSVWFILKSPFISASCAVIPPPTALFAIPFRNYSSLSKVWLIIPGAWLTVNHLIGKIQWKYKMHVYTGSGIIFRYFMIGITLRKEDDLFIRDAITYR